LREPLLGDVEFRHHLDARDDGCCHRAFGLQDLAQHAINAQSDHQSILERLDVDIGSVFFDCLCQQCIDETNDRCIIFAIEQVGLFRQILREKGEIGCVIKATRSSAGIAARLVGEAQQCIEFVGCNLAQM